MRYLNSYREIRCVIKGWGLGVYQLLTPISTDVFLTLLTSQNKDGYGLDNN